MTSEDRGLCRPGSGGFDTFGVGATVVWCRSCRALCVSGSESEVCVCVCVVCVSEYVLCVCRCN